MGRHSAPRASLRSTLTTSRRATAAVRTAAPSRTRRTAVGAGAALAAVALTASTAAALADTRTPATAADTSSPTPAPSPTTLPQPALAAPTPVADPETIDAASDVLIRAEFVASERAGSLSAEQAATIEETRSRLSEAVAAAQSPAGTLPGAAAPSSAAAAGATTDAALAADGETAPSTPAEADDTSADTPDTVGDVAADDATLAARGSERASRSSERARLDELASPLTAAAPLVAPDEVSGSDAPVDEAPADEAPADEAPADVAVDAAAAPAGAEQPGDSAPADGTAGTAGSAPEPAATTEEITTLTAELRTLLDATVAGVAVEVVPGPPSAEEIAAQLDAWASSTAGYGNGQIPTDVLCELSFAPGDFLRCDAAHQIEALNLKYRAAFGADMSVTDSYRSYGSQVAVKASRGYYAAIPGTSNHGWGLALDLGGGVQSYGTAQYEWMRANAPALGWDNPEWARAGGAKNEPWHWEYGDLP